MSGAETFLARFAEAAARRAGPLERLERDLRRLHEGFTGGRGRRPDDYFRGSSARAAYLASIGLPNAARALAVLRSAGAGLLAGERGLDAGSGPGPSALALAALSDPDSEIVLVDRSGPALGDARGLFAELFPDGPRAVTRRGDLRGPGGALSRGPFKTVVAGHVLNEIAPPRGRDPGPAAEVVRSLASRTAPDGALVLIEPAQRIPSRSLSALRGTLVDQGFLPVGPCTHAGPCPVLAPRARDWCVVDVPWERPAVVAEADRLLGMDRRRLSVSFLAASVAAEPPGGRVVEVLSEPMSAKGGVLLYLCGERGRIVLGLPRRPAVPFYRGARLLLPAGARPSGRDRSGAPLFRLAPEDVVRLPPAPPAPER